MSNDSAERVRKRIEPFLQIVLGEVAADKGCAIDDIRLGLVEALRTYGLECYRAGDEDAHERPTLRTEVPDGVWLPSAPVIPRPPRVPKESNTFEVDEYDFEDDAETPVIWKE